MMSTDEPITAPEETSAPAPAAASDDPETVRALARETLAACRDNPADPESLPKLNTVLQLVHDPSLAKEVLAAGDAIIRATLADPSPPPAVHAHMTVLFALLLEYDAARDPVDALFAEWLRHPMSYGPAHATPPDYQREAFVQRLGDMIGWGAVDLKRDREALTRFAWWVDTWTPKNKFRARRAIDLVKRNFPAPDVWNVIHFPQGGGGGDRPQGDRPHGDRPHGDRPQGDRPQGDRPPGNRGRRGRSRGPRDGAPKEGAAPKEGGPPKEAAAPTPKAPDPPAEG